MDGGGTIDAARGEFIERMGVVAQGEGMPRIAGRLFAMLVFDGEAVAFGALAEGLQVSRASVSSSVRLLEERGLVKRVAKAGERQDHFQLAENAYAKMLRGARRRTADAKAEIDATLAELPPGAEGPRRRLGEYAGFYGAIDDALGAAIERLSGGKP